MSNKKSGQAKGKEAENIVEAYLVEQYRPYAANDIVQNLNKSVAKTSVIKALETLVKENRITCKMFGKIAIYVCNEQELEHHDDLSFEEVSFEALMELREELIRVEKDRNEVATQLQSTMKTPSNAEIGIAIDATRKEVAEIQQRLKGLELQWRPEDEKTIRLIKEYEQKIDKQINARKKMWASALLLVKEALAIKNLDEFLEELGVEKVD
ncbi:LAFA_0E16952g1_1 [Lachancea sp. 'fantastica']|nr:LAFA_0E16952g1_1 [Lachancea sp. 'fantastica']